MPSIEINGWKLWYEQYGTGEMPVLMIPGAIGSSKTDFYEQLEGDDILDEDEFTIIAVDPPGSGRSRPPIRKYGSAVYDTDAQCFYQLMKHLGYETYAVIGWSEGATAALWLACKYPKVITKMIISGVIAFTDPKTVSALNTIRKVEGWPKRTVEKYLRSYSSREEIQKLWDKHLMFYEHQKTYFPIDPNETKYKLIDFPVLVLHGDKDTISSIDHAQYVIKRIKTADLQRFQNGEHNLHERYAPIFKKVVEDYLIRDILSASAEKSVYNQLSEIDCLANGMT